MLFLGLAVFAAVAALSHQHERAFSASLIYLGLGLGAAALLEVTGIAWLDPIRNASLVERATEFAVIVALFATGLRLDRPLSRGAWGAVGRLLGVVMIFTIAAVALFGWGVMGLSLGAAIILGAALAPTDPVLAGDIGVGPPGQEEEREPNFAVTADAGLNDGLAFPFLFLGFFI
ncbi:MAG: cation:proton antiporter, partial [Actinobacteria bacterium]|nr:cation:proton antiporter [Actinomycetota bacterium]